MFRHSNKSEQQLLVLGKNAQWLHSSPQTLLKGTSKIQNQNIKASEVGHQGMWLTPLTFLTPVTNESNGMFIYDKVLDPEDESQGRQKAPGVLKLLLGTTHYIYLYSNVQLRKWGQLDPGTIGVKGLAQGPNN